MLFLIVALAYGKEYSTVAAAADADIAFLTESGCAPQSEFEQTRESLG